MEKKKDVAVRVTMRLSIKVTDHESVTELVSRMTDPDQLTIDEVVERIITLNDGLRQFWGNSEGWAPLEAAHLLTRSRLDWQVSLSRCLKLWIDSEPTTYDVGHLILAWANLGSLVEGSLKLFLSAWFETYKTDVAAIRRREKLQTPGELQLEALRIFFKNRIWDDSLDQIVRHIQFRRNSIHAFADRDIGTYEDFVASVRAYLQILRYINSRLPYPDELYVPQETNSDWLSDF